MATASPQQTQRQCVACGRQISWDANVCPYCGHDYRQPAPGAPMMPMAPMKERTSLPLAGGIMLIIDGVLGIVSAIMVMAAGSLAEAIGTGFGLEGLGSIVVAMGVIGLVFSLIVIFGGYFATQRRHFGLAIVGAVFSLIVGIFTFYFIGAVLGLIGLILIAVAHKEFD
ncbi:MAG: hypothetical protein OEV21_06775 [Thermoplasmata archaeon]|nr:hypothetical protein [Thermoplasmata archaeon]